MITLYDHIQELRAELRGCYFTAASVLPCRPSWKGDRRTSRTRPRIRRGPGGAVESRRGDRGRRVGGPSPPPLLFAIYATQCYHPLLKSAVQQAKLGRGED